MSTMTVTFEVAEELSKGLAKGLLKFQSGVIKNVETGKYAYHVFPIKEIKSGILGITPQMAPAICIGVGIAAATGVICYRIEKAKTKILENLKLIHKDVEDIKDMQEADFFGGILASIERVNKVIPNTIEVERIRNYAEQEDGKLGDYEKKIHFLVDEMLSNLDVWNPEWFATLSRLMLCYIYVGDAHLKVRLELGEYPNAYDFLDKTVIEAKKIFERFEQICQKDNEFIALGGLSKSQREEYAMLQESVEVLENRKELVLYMQEHKMLMSDIRELSKGAKDGQEIMLLAA